MRQFRIGVQRCGLLIPGEFFGYNDNLVDETGSG